jgi:hypothetical protein
LLVPPRDGKAIAEALAMLAGDRERLSWMSRACRRRIRAAFSIDRLAAEFAQQYARLCGDVAVAGSRHSPLPSARRHAPARRAAPANLTGEND